MLAAQRLPTGALRPPVAVGPSDEDEEFAGYGGRGAGAGGGAWDLPPSRSHSSGPLAWQGNAAEWGGGDFDVGGRGGGAGWGGAPDRGWSGDPLGAFDFETPGSGPVRSAGMWNSSAGDYSQGPLSGERYAGERYGSYAADRYAADRYAGERYSRAPTRGPSGGYLEVDDVVPSMDDADLYPSPHLGGGAIVRQHAAGYGGMGGAAVEPVDIYSSNMPSQNSRAPVKATVLGVAAQQNQIVKVQPAATFQKEVQVIPQGMPQVRALNVPPTVPVVQQRALVPQAALMQPSAAIGSIAVQPLKMAEHWVASYAPPSVGRTSVMAYPSGTLVNFQELAAALAPCAAANALHRARIVPAIESGDLVRRTLQIYQACDRDANGFLSWNNGEIRDFISSVFQQQGLSPPNEQMMYQLYSKFDSDKNSVLDARECLCLADALFRATFFAEPQAQSGLPAMSAAWQGSMQAALPVAPVPLPHMPVQPLNAAAAPAAVKLPPPPMGQMQWPAAPALAPAPALAAVPSVMAGPQPLPPMRGLAGSNTPPMMPPNMLHPHEEMSPPPMEDGLMQAQPPPLPPAFHTDHEARPHVLDVELEELELHPGAPDMEAAWYHSVKYFVSLHPRSENPESIPLPRDAPKATIDGEYLVSKVLPPKKSQVRVGMTRGNSSDSEEEHQHRSHIPNKKAGGSSNPVVDFREHLSLRMHHLDQHLVAFIWGKKSSMLDESVTLVGRALAPLQDFNLQRRSTTWGVFDVLHSHRVAEMRVRYSVATTPSAIREPTLTDVHQTDVKIVWQPPDNDHGAPLLGYRVSIMLESKEHPEPRWFTLCECTKSLNPVYVVANLKGNKGYAVDVRAVNKVGPGDPCEFQIHTGPVEPEPPSKPWIEEARDGCVNVAWHPSQLGDGGSPLVAFKVRMRKILGASRWNPFGPGESKAIWVDMGSVAAAAVNDSFEGGASMYNAWLGPLEMQACEYRFQIVAANSVGESAGSELSDPIYT